MPYPSIMFFNSNAAAGDLMRKAAVAMAGEHVAEAVQLMKMARQWEAMMMKEGDRTAGGMHALHDRDSDSNNNYSNSNGGPLGDGPALTLRGVSPPKLGRPAERAVSTGSASAAAAATAAARAKTPTSGGGHAAAFSRSRDNSLHASSAAAAALSDSPPSGPGAAAGGSPFAHVSRGRSTQITSKVTGSAYEPSVTLFMYRYAYVCSCDGGREGRACWRWRWRKCSSHPGCCCSFSCQDVR